MMKVAKKQSLTEKATNGFEYVHHMKEDEPLLGGKAGIKPGKNPGETITVYVTEGLWSTQIIKKLPIIDDNLPHLATSSFSVRSPSSSLTTEKNEDTKISHIPGKSICSREKIVFLSHNSIIAFGIREKKSLQRSYTIYGTTPIAPGQRPSTDEKLEDHYTDLDHNYGDRNSNEFTDDRPKRKYYTWMRAHENLWDNKFSIDLFGPKGYHKLPFKSQKIKTGFLQPITFLWSKDGHPAMLMRRGYFPDGVKGPAWELTVAPGIDPMLMVCFVSILDETQGGPYFPK